LSTKVKFGVNCPSELPVHLAILITKGGLVKAEMADQVCVGAMLK